MERDPDLATLLEDVKTIKKILQNEDASLPRIWRIVWPAAALITTLGLVQYFVPWFRNLDFDGRVFWLWLPAACVAFPLALAFFYREVARSGKQFLGQGRVRHLLFARFIVPPATFVLIWVASRNTAFSLEGTILVILSIWLTIIEQLPPEGFRPLPVVYLCLGLVELTFGFQGPETTLLNVMLVAGTLTFGGFLFWRQDRIQSRSH